MLRSITVILLALLLTSCADLKLANKAYKEGNYKLAVEYWEVLSKAGFPEAKLKLSRMYNKGIGVKKTDHKKAYSLLIEASKYKKTESKSFFEIGKMYQRGQWLGLSVTKAEKFYKKSFSLGNKKAAYYLAKLYEKEPGFKKSSDRIKDLYNKAYELGYKKPTSKLKASIKK